MEQAEQNTELARRLLQRGADLCTQDGDWRGVHAMAVQAKQLGDVGLARMLLHECLALASGNSDVVEEESDQSIVDASQHDVAGDISTAGPAASGENGIDIDTPVKGFVASTPRDLREHHFSGTLPTEDAFASVYHALALLEKEQGNLESARQAFRAATSVYPDYAYAWQAWAILEKECGDIDTARSYFRKACEFTPSGPKSEPCWHAFASMEEQEGNSDDARTLYQQGLEAYPRSTYLWTSLAALEATAGNWPTARECFVNAVRTDPSRAIGHTIYAWAKAEMYTGQADSSDGDRVENVSLNHAGPSVSAGRAAFRAIVDAASADADNTRKRDNVLLVKAWAQFESAVGNVELSDHLSQRLDAATAETVA